MSTITVLLADDHASVRRGTRVILESDRELEVVAEAVDGAHALQLAMAHCPRVLVLDVELPILTGTEVVRRARAQGYSGSILMVSAYDDAPYVLSAMRAGANGYVLKTAEAPELVAAVHAVVAGHTVLDKALATQPSLSPTAHASHLPTIAHGAPRLREPLSPREADVLQQVARGHTNKAIAAEMQISDRTVQVHIANIFAKLDATSRTEAAMIALRRGLVTLA